MIVQSGNGNQMNVTVKRQDAMQIEPHTTIQTREKRTSLSLKNIPLQGAPQSG